jgi:hypothetical protein
MEAVRNVMPMAPQLLVEILARRSSSDSLPTSRSLFTPGAILTATGGAADQFLVLKKQSFSLLQF